MIFGLVLLLSACAPTLDRLNIRSQGALQVTTPDQSFSIFLDNNYLGQTPFLDERIKTGEYTLSLREVNSNQNLWQSRIQINRRSLTVVNYTYATKPEDRSSEIIFLQPHTDSGSAKLSISTLPDHVVVKINDQVQGFTPLTVDNLDPTEKRISLEAPGYISKTIQAKTIQGQHLIIQAQLGRDSQLDLEAQPDTSEATSSPEIVEVPEDSNFGTQEAGVSLGFAEMPATGEQFVQILPATVGINWLRVRSSPNSFANNEVARVRVGDFFPYIEDSDNGEWRRIEYAPDQEGWISLRYGELVSSQSSQ